MHANVLLQRSAHLPTGLILHTYTCHLHHIYLILSSHLPHTSLTLTSHLPRTYLRFNLNFPHTFLPLNSHWKHFIHQCKLSCRFQSLQDNCIIKLKNWWILRHADSNSCIDIISRTGQSHINIFYLEESTCMCVCKYIYNVHWNFIVSVSSTNQFEFDSEFATELSTIINCDVQFQQFRIRRLT